MNPIVKFLVWAGIISECCHARTYRIPGWNRLYCKKCHQRLY